MRAYMLFQRISDEDATLLWMQPAFSKPHALITWAVPVPPVPIRPSVPMDVGGGSNEDDLTVKLQEIVEVNNALRMALDNGATMKMVAEDWEFLQIQVAQYVNGEIPGIPRAMAAQKPIRGICQRLKGKQGRFRGNLSGKRVDFSGRTVISPDPNLRVEQIGVPELVAKVMTYPERVNRYNIEKLRQHVINGPEVHPGANFIRPEHGMVRSLAYGNRAQAAASLRIGDTVERHMIDDDIVLFNRQPSLHKMSIMAHRVKVFPWRTFRFNECACTPYNADYDGDEMNLHLPQTEEARAEAAELMLIVHNLITPRNGEPLVAAIQDFLTGAFLLTRKDTFFTKDEFCRVVAYLSDASEHVEVPVPAILAPRQLWTGKQVLTMLIKPNSKATSLVNFENKEKFYTKDKYMCEKDGYVAFCRGELMCGNLGKKTLGGDSKNGLFYVLIRDYGAPEATRCMSRLAKLCSRYLADRGFSIGIDDVTPSIELQHLKQGILSEGQRGADAVISDYESGRIRLKPGCNALQSLESEVNGILGKIREQCGQEAVKILRHTNSPHIMAQCGSKGSQLNISQMVACLGQQSVGGSRIQDGFVNRTLPHFPLGALFPAAKGFVGNSFFSGLTATEFFFHTMGGREGLVDTAVKTAETGYMARRLMKALEDLSMQYDSAVRNSENTIVQFSYGDDGLNPQMMEGGDRPVDFNRLFTNITTLHPCPDEATLTSTEVKSLVDNELLKDRFLSLLPQGQLFLNEVRDFIYKKASEIERLDALASPDGQDATVVQAIDVREQLSRLSPDDLREWLSNARLKGSAEYRQAFAILKDNVARITRHQVHMLLNAALRKYHLSMVEPGEAVGAVGAQSLSEPGTQMTLKTFHFAGVASMNVTLGVPRLKEIINASKAISTPIITARLVQTDNKTTARIAKAQIEKTTLGEIVEYIREVHCRDMSYVLIKLDMKAIQGLHLSVNADTVRSSILNYGGIPKSAILRALKDKHVMVVSNGRSNKIKVMAPEVRDTGKYASTMRRLYFNIQALKSALPKVIVQGIPTVSRAIINEEDSANRKEYYLLVEGYGLSSVMGANGVDGRDTKSNHIIEMQNVLGIEAARSTITSEINYIMSAYGITVDRRHLLLLADVMTFKGEILGITRFGVAKMRESVLMLASFEKTTDHLFDAAVHAREDSIVGVSECIIMGVPIPLGTGLFKLLHKSKAPTSFKRRTRLLETIMA